MKKFFSIILILIVTTNFFIIGINIFISYKYSNKILNNIKAVSNFQAALVLGTSVLKNKKPSAILKERLNRAIELYKNKKITKILISGDNTKKYYDEVNVMKNYLLLKNIPSEDIFLDHNGIRTLDSIYRAKYIFNAKNLIVISQKFHLPRVLYLADVFHLKAIGYNADSELVKVKNFIFIREYLATFLAFIDTKLLNRKAKFIGKKKYNLNGNGKITWNKDN